MTGVPLVDLIWIGAALALATLLSEDLACIAAGVLVAEGRIPFVPAVLACGTGILAGDLLLFVAGRVIGRRLLEWPGIRRRIDAPILEESARWLRRHGPAAILLTRFLPGTRLPTYVAAGILRSNGLHFTLWFIVAAAIWTPMLVGLSAVAGAEVARASIASAGGIVLHLAITATGLLAAGQAISALASWTNRRRLMGWWRRLSRWEFWPAWVLYPPVVMWILLLMVRHRSLTVATAVNPGIPGGGLIGESKFDILRGLAPAGGRIARAALLSGDLPAAHRIHVASQFMQSAGLSFPVVLKPDRGQRGAGVTIARTVEAAASRIAQSSSDLIVQEYAPGLEFGVFYYRHPSWERGRIYSITEKQFPIVTGDGVHTLEALILADERAVCLEPLHCRTFRADLSRVPASGERIRLVEIGSHCLGALFLDATHLRTPTLEAVFDEVARQFDGFYFGRFDVRTPSVEEFTRGESFKIVELNGLTSEATHIYDPKHGLLTAYRVLFEQWRIAFDIAAENRRRGSSPASVSALLDLALHYRRDQQGRTRLPQYDAGASV